MSRSFVDPRLFDLTRGMPLPTQWAWMYLVTHKLAQEVPGLFATDYGRIAAERKVPLVEVELAIRPLLERGLAIFDPIAELFRMPCMPGYFSKPGPNQIRGWHRNWVTTPESSLKYDHVATLQAIVPGQNSPAHDVWVELFGNCLSLASPMPLQPGSTQMLLALNSHIVGRVREPTDPDPETDPLPETDTDPKTDPRRGSAEGEIKSNWKGTDIATKPSTSSDLYSRAERLWSLQEQLRAQISGLDPLPASPRALRRVVACLETIGATDEQAAKVLNRYLRHAQDNPEKALFFDGIGNWEPTNFERQLGRPDEVRSNKGHYKVTGRERYAGGDVKL